MPEERTGKRDRKMEQLETGLARMRVPLGFLCGGAVLYLARPTPRSLMIGGAIALAGELVRVWAAGHLDKGREVTQSGPYRFTRHPLYLGSAIVAIGAAIASAQLGAVAIIGLYMTVTIVAAVRHEEENMRATFGGVYDAYMHSRVAAVERAFSLNRALSINKEYKAILGLAALVAIFAAKIALR